MLVLIQIVSVITYSLSIAIVAQSKKKKYLTRHGKPRISDAIMVWLNRKHDLFVTFDHHNSFKNNSTVE